MLRTAAGIVVLVFSSSLKASDEKVRGQDFFLANVQNVIGCYKSLGVLSPAMAENAPSFFPHPVRCLNKKKLHLYRDNFRQDKGMSSIQLKNFKFDPMFEEGEIEDERIYYGQYSGTVSWSVKRAKTTYNCEMGIRLEQTTNNVKDRSGKPIIVDDGDYSLEVFTPLSCN